MDGHSSNNYSGNTWKTGFKAKVQRCKKIVEEGKLFQFSTLIEEVIEESIDNYQFNTALYFTHHLLKITPYNADLWVSKGICFSHLKQPVKAHKAFDKALSLNPLDTDAMIEKALLAVQAKDYDEAEDLLLEALNIEPENEITNYRLGKLYQRKRQHRNAVSYFRKVLEIDPDFSDAHFQIALCFEFMRNNAYALKAYEDYLDKEPDCEVGWFNRGIVLEQMKRYTSAINSYELSIALDEHFVDAWFNLGNLLADIGRHKDAINTFRTVIKLDKDDEAAYYNLATVFEDIGNFAEAEKHYNEAIMRHQDYQDAYLGRGYCRLGQGKFAEALDDLRDAFATNPGTVSWSNYDESVTGIDEGLLRKAGRLREELKENSADENTLMEYADCCIGLYNLDQARSSVAQILKISKESGWAYMRLAQIYFIKRSNIRGLYCIRKAFELDKLMMEQFKKDFRTIAASKLFKELINFNSLVGGKK